MYIAGPDALKGNLMDYMTVAQPQHVTVVPRVFEKIQEKMLEIGKQNGWVKTKVAKWAKKTALDHFQKERVHQVKMKYVQYSSSKNPNHG